MTTDPTPDETDAGQRTPAPAISLPKGGGAIRGIGEKFSANPVTGTGNMTVPIVTSQGRSGFGPQLALTYDSGSGNGPFGVGWRLSLASITRKTDKGLPKYHDADESDVFLLSDVEDLVPMLDAGGHAVIDGSSVPGWTIVRYRPRIEGSFARIERWTSQSDGDAHWRTYSADNVLAVYGRTAQSRITDPADPCRVLSWLLCETRDDRGNAVLYTYKQEDAVGVDVLQSYERNRGAAGSPSRTANRYIKRIRYGNRVPLLDETGLRPVDLSAAQLFGADWMFEVVFDYGEHDEGSPAPGDAGAWLCRNDPFSSYRAGFEIRTYRLCQRILTFHHFPEPGVGADCLVRSTNLAYQDIRGIRSDRQRGHPVASLLDAVTQAGYIRTESGYTNRSLPPVTFEYTRATLSSEVRQLDPESLQNLPVGIDDLTYRWADLNGEGLAGVLTEQANAWFYRSNLGEGRLGPVQCLGTRPAIARLSGGEQQLVDLSGDGLLDLVQFSAPPAGFVSRTGEGWEDFVPFRALPAVDWKSPGLMLIDLTGDGRADLILADDNVLTWYPSLGHDGFAAPRRAVSSFDEDRGPRLVLADDRQTIFVADMSGDGLADLVRVRNGEVCYWPNIGYGQFGSRVVMSSAPWFDRPDQFDPHRLRLIDVDGSGTTDILYLGANEVCVWSNESGNGWAARQRLSNLPPLDNSSAAQVADLLGNGTACLVWSSSLPSGAGRQVRYVDLMGGTKPYLLVKTTNNLGAESRVRYAPSTKFYLDDRQAGRQWITRLPFPVHVVVQVEHIDLISRTRFAAQYAYHHGYFDGVEREFRGFAMVERKDSEAYEGYAADVRQEDRTQELAPELYQPPVTTRTWFHTGAYLGWDRVLHQLRDEYYGRTQHTAEPALPDDMDAEEARECARALKGRVLRYEVYSFDDSAQAVNPYQVVEYGHEVQRIQPRGTGRHAVFLARTRETITHQYERNPSDPRISHSLDLAVGPYGNVLRSASVVYGRRTADPALPAEVTDEQRRLSIVYGETDYTPDFDVPGPRPAYRLRTPYESHGYEVTGVVPIAEFFTPAELDGRIAVAADLDYEASANGRTPQKRLLSRLRTLFRDNALAPLGIGQWDTLGLEYENYRLAFTHGVTSKYYSSFLTDADFTAAGYVHTDGDADWWLPSGTALYPDDPAAHFFLPTGTRDPMGLQTLTTFDRYHLLPERVSVPKAAWNEVRAVNDYRVLSPVMVTDPNQNRTAVTFDALGLVVRSATMGKQDTDEGDTLDDPTTRLEYELFNWMKNRKPNYTHVLAREEHGPVNLRWQESYVYSNGSGGVAMVKVRAHPGKVRRTDPDGRIAEVDANPRWIGNGRVILNNKGNPVKQYEPYFSTTHEYEDEEAVRAVGVTPVRYYDPLGRNVRTEFPDGTLVRTEFSPWLRRDFDGIDTVRQSRWYIERGSPDPRSEPEPRDDPQRRAAWLAAKHANTPTTLHVDSLGRPIYTVFDYGSGITAAVRSEKDLTGHQYALYDQNRRQVASGFSGMLGTPIIAESADTGRHWTFSNVLGATVTTWDDQGRRFRAEYDELHRPVSAYVQESGRPETLFTYVVYGDRHPDAVRLNLLGVAHQTFDQAGMTRVAALDFQGNPQSVDRVLISDSLHDPDWAVLRPPLDYAAIQAAAAPALESELWTVSSAYDALNRPTRTTLPDGTVVVPAYDEAGFLSTLRAQVRGVGQFLDFLKGQDYDAKGQRKFAHYGNDVYVRYSYDPATFRLTNLLTHHAADHTAAHALQNISYTYDPVGNATQITDGAQQTYFFRNAVVRPEFLYEYDALYQLIRATGREHAGATNDAIRNHDDLPSVPQVPFENDATAVREYSEEYGYDLLGNITMLRHRFKAQAGVGAGWTRHYRYAYQDNPADRSNQLSATSSPGDPDDGPYSATYAYDASGNMTGMPQFAELRWNALHQLSQVNLGSGGTAYYHYDAQGQRIQKVIQRPGGQRLEWIYLGAVEIYRERNGNAEPHLERSTVHLADGTGRIAQVDTKVRDENRTNLADPPDNPLIRYLYGNHLGSSVLETDAAGQVITYQDYHPYGTSAYRYALTGPGLSQQRYRFVGKERDGETGLDYFGARYYASWLGRWISSDPAGLIDGLNLFAYCHNNPIIRTDPDGTKVEVIAPVKGARRLLDPEKKAEARTYIEGVITSRLSSEHQGQRFVIDKMHFDTRTGKWSIDKSHWQAAGSASSNAPPPQGGDAGGSPAAGSAPNPTAPPGAGGTAADNPDGSTGGTVGGSAAGGPSGGPTGQPGGSGHGSPGANAEDAPGERTFWDRGGRTLLLGLGIVALGLLTVATGGGALVMFAAGMAIGAGVGTVAASSYQLATPNSRTAEEDRKFSGAISDAALVASSPGSAIGGAIGYAANGREGMRTGAFFGGLAEGAVSLGVAGFRANAMRAAGPGIAEPVGEVTIQQWQQMTAEQRTLYEWGQKTVRSGVWKQIVDRGIQGNPIAKGRFLFDAFGSRWGILTRAWNPLMFARTLGTGGTPGAAYLGSYLAHGVGAGLSAGYGRLSSEFN
jgi:RHS repeat-associated protein